MRFSFIRVSIAMLGHALIVAPALGQTLQTFGTSQHQRSYCFKDIGNLPGGEFIDARAMNERGQIVGVSRVQGVNHAFIWDRKNGIRDLSSMPGGIGAGIPFDINSRGQVVGSRFTDASVAFIWDADSGTRDLEFPPGVDSAAATGINESGQIVGYTQTATEFGFLKLPVAWDGKNLRIRALEDFADAIGKNTPEDINNAGQVVGSSLVHEVQGGSDLNVSIAYVLDRPNGIRDIGTLQGGVGAAARAINDAGQVVGGSRIPGEGHGGAHAFLWSAQTGMQDLGDLPGGQLGIDLSEASDINNRGEIVGFSEAADRGFLATYWSRDGRIRDLNELLVRTSPEDSFIQLIGAAAINNKGEIAAVGRDTRDSRQHAYFLTPLRKRSAADDSSESLGHNKSRCP